MKSYKQFTVGTLIEALAAMEPGAEIAGLSASVDSYRGYYEHVAIEPGASVPVGLLREQLLRKLGTKMYGYKGGEYTFDIGCLVFVAHDGLTGPALIGFDGLEPVTAAESWI